MYLLEPTAGQISSTRAIRALRPRRINVTHQAQAHHTLATCGLTTPHSSKPMMKLSRRRHSLRQLIHHHQDRVMTLLGGNGPLRVAGTLDQLMVTTLATQLTGRTTGLVRRPIPIIHHHLIMRNPLQYQPGTPSGPMRVTDQLMVTTQATQLTGVTTGLARRPIPFTPPNLTLRDQLQH